MQLRINIKVLLITILLCHMTLAAPSLRVKRAEELSLNPVNLSESEKQEIDREKRKLPEAAFQSKNAVLGFVFGASSASAHSVGSASRGAINAFSPTKPPIIKTTTDDTPDFDRSKVSLDIPDKLFGSSFTTVTNISKIIGDLMTNTSRRTAQFLWIFKPLFGNALKIEIPDPTTTTTESNRR